MLYILHCKRKDIYNTKYSNLKQIQGFYKLVNTYLLLHGNIYRPKLNFYNHLNLIFLVSVYSICTLYSTVLFLFKLALFSKVTFYSWLGLVGKNLIYSTYSSEDQKYNAITLIGDIL